MSFQFTSDWVNQHRATWTQIFGQWPPKKLLEIGAFEGRGTCFMLELLQSAKPVEIYCVDTWLGGEEHSNVDMDAVEARFASNVAHAKTLYQSDANVFPLKGKSFDMLTKLYANSHAGTFDLIYVDGSHQAPDVLGDLILTYHLAKIGGVIICDDYVWRVGNVLHEPKVAIDAFINIFRDRLTLIVDVPLRQIYFLKIA